MNIRMAPGQQIIKLAILAIGGQGGGVITDWIVHLAERNGWYAQATSVPGVAQRTGATIYYVEMVPETGRTPILSLMPAPGDVDVVIAAELMEAGRAIMRGFVTSDRTTLIASSHRAFAVGEKTAPGDGIGNSEAVLHAAGRSSKRFIARDLDAAAAQAGSVISASLFGALAAASVLPFPKASFIETVRAGGKGAEASLRAFEAGFEAVLAPPAAAKKEDPPVASMSGPAELLQAYRSLVARLEDEVPEPAHEMAKLGLAKAVDFQDIGYGSEYLDRLSRMSVADRQSGGEGRGFPLTRETAKYLANAMAYDDIIRVADRKTRAARFERVRSEAGLSDDRVMAVTEFMHPRMQEICGTLPAGLGRWIEARPKLFSALDKVLNRGRRVRSDGMFWFTVLFGLSGLRRHRRRLLRHSVEMASIADWLDKAERLASRNYDLAVEVIRCRRLIKGYSDTHARGLSKFDRVLSALPLLEPREDGAAWLRRLREAALADEPGTALDGALKTVASL